MEKKKPSVANVLAELPAVQQAIKREVAARIAAGDNVVSEDTPAVRGAMSARKAASARDAAHRTVSRKSAA